MSNMDDENSNSSNSSTDEDTEKELLNRAEELEKQLSANKYLYDNHVEVISTYRKLMDLNSMREAYQRFRECFPLTPKIWLEWIKDEIKIASTKEEQQHILNLFDQAVEDYLSVELWTEYAQYSIGLGDIQKTRTILERALTSAGLHVSKGYLLWDTFREIEHTQIALLKKDSEEWVNQIKRLAEIFKRQLSVPLLNMQSTYFEWNEWYKTLPEGLIDSKPIEWGYKKALQMLEIYEPFEEKLLSAEHDELYHIYKEYTKAVKDTSTILCIYERAVVPLCLTVNIWEDYIKFSFKLEQVTLKLTGRALRNCTWSEDLWIARMRALEYHKIEEKDILTCFEQGVMNINPSPPLQFWLSFLEYYHRNSEDTTKLKKLFSQALEQLLPEHDPSYKISRWYARLLAKRGDMESVRSTWNNVMADQQYKSSASAWLEYANLEKQYGEPNQVRNVFKRALVSCKEWPQYIAEEWAMFEREFGALEDVMKCEEKCKAVLKKVERHATSRYEDSEPTTSSSRKRKYDDTDKMRGAKRKYGDSDDAPRRRRRNESEDFNFKKLKVSQESHDGGHKYSRPPSKLIENKDPKTTVFVSNLHPSVDEQTLKELFPNALNINVVIDRKGKSRCFGYMQFSKEEECMTALASDRIPIDGRPVFVSQLKSDKIDKKTFKYAQTAEDNKLFVKGLPSTKSKEDVEEIFKAYNPTDVRLVFKKNGQSKGIAYVEFNTAEEAEKALKECRSMKIDDQEVTVAVSAPPPKKMSEKPEQNEPTRHARSRLQVPLMPRTLLVKSNTEKAQITAKTDTTDKGAKSNDDFRNMFLKK